MPDLHRLLGATTPCTLTRVAAGYAPLLGGDLARLIAHANGGRLLWIAPDEQAMQAMGEAAGWFAPNVETILFPAWDCLPYDRTGPSLRASSQRMAALARLQVPTKNTPQIVITTAAAIAQRTLTPFRIRQLSADIRPGTRIGRDKVAAMLVAQGYARTDTVADHGEFAVRGGIVISFRRAKNSATALTFSAMK